tara:strand:- start:365 stop:769 length:405 start_codon:yes stop_codon:yes gene_type:complete
MPAYDVLCKLLSLFEKAAETLIERTSSPDSHIGDAFLLIFSLSGWWLVAGARGHVSLGAIALLLAVSATTSCLYDRWSVKLSVPPTIAYNPPSNEDIMRQVIDIDGKYTEEGMNEEGDVDVGVSTVLAQFFKVF